MRKFWTSARADDIARRQMTAALNKAPDNFISFSPFVLCLRSASKSYPLTPSHRAQRELSQKPDQATGSAFQAFQAGSRSMDACIIFDAAI
jgi:hypothetical protein